MTQPGAELPLPTDAAPARARIRLVASIHDVHPGSLSAVQRRAPSIVESIGKALAAFTRNRAVGRCADLLAA